ncbi:MAG: hemerythrin domain-containing protein [Nocardiopsaceae bacterium]|nr:hemerythrin domain-containing protein [Nocardiopsaceae bacterium]
MTDTQLLSRPASKAADGVPRPAPGLTDEHEQLLRQVAVRAEALLAVATAGHWPARELAALLGYLRAEILRQAADEETLLFPASGPHPGLTRLARDHVRLRAGIEALEHAARDPAGSLAVLATTTQDLLCQLERHLAAEEAVLAGAGGTGSTPATTDLGARPHEWYPLTEGPVIDLDALPPGQDVDAAVERLRRLRRGERAELRGSADLSPVWLQISRFAPGRYSFACLEDGPGRWRVQVTRRDRA